MARNPRKIATSEPKWRTRCSRHQGYQYKCFHVLWQSRRRKWNTILRELAARSLQWVNLAWGMNSIWHNNDILLVLLMAFSNLSVVMCILGLGASATWKEGNHGSGLLEWFAWSEAVKINIEGNLHSFCSTCAKDANAKTAICRAQFRCILQG